MKRKGPLDILLCKTHQYYLVLMVRCSAGAMAEDASRALCWGQVMVAATVLVRELGHSHVGSLWTTRWQPVPELSPQRQPRPVQSSGAGRGIDSQKHSLVWWLAKGGG
jgi:hypothetical protein